MALLKLLHPINNFGKLKQEIDDLVNEIGFTQNQIICQGLTPDHADWATGIGRIDELEHSDEHLYQHIHPRLKDTELEKLMITHNAYRTRIMLMNSRRCYSIHADPTPRVHVPIITNEQCWMIWPTESKCHRMAPGLAYWADTTKPHTFINGSTVDRIHLVMCINKD